MLGARVLVLCKLCIAGVLRRIVSLAVLRRSAGFPRSWNFGLWFNFSDRRACTLCPKSNPPLFWGVIINFDGVPACHLSSSKALRAGHTREEPQERAWCSQLIKTGFLNIAALRGSAFDPLAARPFLSPLHHPCRAANLIIPLHRHTQAPNIIHLAPSNFSSPQITAQASLLWLSLPRRYRGARVSSRVRPGTFWGSGSQRSLRKAWP